MKRYIINKEEKFCLTPHDNLTLLSRQGIFYSQKIYYSHLYSVNIITQKAETIAQRKHIFSKLRRVGSYYVLPMDMLIETSAFYRHMNKYLNEKKYILDDARHEVL